MKTFGRSPFAAFAASLGVSGRVFGLLAVLELLLMTPLRDLASPRVWWSQALTHGAVAVAVAVGGVALLWLAAGAHRLRITAIHRLAITDWTLGLATLVVGFGHGWPVVKTPLVTLLGRHLALMLLAASLIAGYLLVRRWAARPVEQLAAPLACAAAGLLAYYLLRAAPLGLRPQPRAVALTLLTVFLALLAIGLMRGRATARPGFAGVLVVVMVLATRALAPAPHALIRQPMALDAPRPRADSAPGSVFLLVLDTLRQDALTLDRETDDERNDERNDERDDEGRPRTPNLARLAAQSDVFYGAIANGSWTLPSHASLFTGLRVSQHRVDMTSTPGFTSQLPPSIATLHEQLARRGYSTSCISANGIVSPATGLTRGCQRYWHPGRTWTLQTLPLRLWYALTPSPRPALEEQLMTQLTSAHRTARATEVIRLARRELATMAASPYLFLNFMDAHKPYSPSPASDGRARRAFFLDLLRVLAGRLAPEDFDRTHAALLHRGYADQVAKLDHALGSFFDTLRARGLYDDALIVVTADHGEAFHDNPSLPLYYDHHGAFEPAVRIPLIIKRPRQRLGRQFHQPIAQADIAPAILDLIAGETKAGVTDTGVLFDNQGRQPLLTEWNPHPIPGAMSTLPLPRVGLYRDGFKLVVEGNWRRPLDAEHPPTVSLFDLGASPFETVEVGARYPDRLAAMYAELRLLHPQTGPADEAAPVPPEAPDPELLDTLRALGYVQ